MHNQTLQQRLQRRLDVTIAERALYKNAPLPYGLTSYQQKLETELKQHEEYLSSQKKAAQASWWARAKKKTADFFRSVRDYLLDIANLGGTIGFVANIIVSVGEIGAITTTAVGYFLAVVASPLALTAISIGVMMENYDIYTNNEIKQRKTRYAVNLFTFALAVLAMVIALGFIASAPPFSIGILFGGIIGAGYYKDHYILKQLSLKITDKEQEGVRIKNELLAAIDQEIKTNPEIEFYQQELTKDKQELKQLLSKPAPTQKDLDQIKILRERNSEHQLVVADLLLKNPYLHRLTLQYAEHQDAYNELKITQSNLKTAQQIRRWSLVGVALIVSGGILALTFPPAAGLLLVLGGLMVLGTVIKNYYQASKEKQAAGQLKKELDSRIDSSHERGLVAHVYDTKLDAVKSTKLSTTFIAPHIGGITQDYPKPLEHKQHQLSAVADPSTNKSPQLALEADNSLKLSTAPIFEPS